MQHYREGEKTKTQRALELQAAGLSYRDIAETLNTSVDSVRGLLWRYKDRPYAPKRPTRFKELPDLKVGQRLVVVKLAGDLDDYIREQCAARDIALSTLCSAILASVFEDQLIDAILDGGPEG